METIGMLRHKTIQSLTTQHADMNAEGSIALWNQVANQIILLVGEAGFQSLYARSVFVSQSQFPWLVPDGPSVQASHRFANLKTCLQAQPQALATEANRLLLITLTDILASLIGEPLTTSIMDSAWGSNAQMKADKEQKNEQ